MDEQRSSAPQRPLTRIGRLIPQPYPYLRRTLLGSGLAALLAGALLLVASLVWLILGSTINAATEFALTASQTLSVSSDAEGETGKGTASSVKGKNAKSGAPTLPKDVTLGVFRDKVRESGLPYREHARLGLTDAARQVDFALLQTIRRLGVGHGRLQYLTSTYNNLGTDRYFFQRMRLLLPCSVETFFAALEESLEAWAEWAVLSREGNKLSLGVNSVRTHELWVDEIGATFMPPPAASKPRLTIVIDDMGQNLKAAKTLLGLEIPVTLSVWPFASHAAQTSELAHKAGREVLVHQPMEPMQSPFLSAGEDQLTVDMTQEVIDAILARSVRKVPHAVGLNNHMGSKFTRHAKASRLLSRAAAQQGLFVLDSVTYRDTVLFAQARQEGLPAYRRAVFLDDGMRTQQTVLRQLQETERIARKQGQAIAIGHPHPETLAALKQWAQHRDQSILVVPLRYQHVPVETLRLPHIPDALLHTLHPKGTS